ncbi:hypothetical protein SERLA73DRAFT_180611 [Serpula lacrymans var. lacrymans S7.3]|uniref:Copper transport protein n=2 Tax=Serpula lacrymans var. lacrymans TaxID=341189 RepID=F8PVN7_SERL3|nr:uncharacterized protein SERLADRAFT_466285 [Serpula lacrymans var. lacrymans S7.9]EGO00171.1 hypothetical protein SERLA73DRAFT_180611 [Serpula lacrymans var. lacrymans S7.3]EGO25731.1 hypothetical protein SERLADRAFT_466285 [Serpula lacrymans var. lacrymans S7.9]
MAHQHAGHDMPGHDMPGHDMPGMGPKCSMSMLWNTNIIDTCIVFPQWHISSHTGFVLSCLVIVGLGVLYEYLRVFQRQVDRRIALSLGKGKSRARSSSGRNSPTNASDFEEAALLTGRRTLKPSKIGTPVPPFARALRASLYGVSVFLSFFLMLVFMTYNAYLILAVVVGAVIGHFIFGSHVDFDNLDTAKNGMFCH